MVEKFSSQLEGWLKSSRRKTLSSLSEVFGERSFAILILLLMSPAALPLPTGGITHVLEIISMLLALEMIAGRRTLWLPKRFAHRKLGGLLHDKALPFIVRRVRWFEKFSRPRLLDLMQQRGFGRLVGLLLFVLSLAAFLAPPFSGLDTLPALGAVMLALGVILGDVIIVIGGTVIGAIGTGLVVALSELTITALKHLF